MQVPVQITFHQLEPSPSVEERIREKVAKLEHLHQGIISCRVVVEPVANQHHHGPVLYSVRFELGLAGGKTIVGGGSGTKNDGLDDVHAALKAAFEATKRQLQDHHEKERQFVATDVNPGS